MYSQKLHSDIYVRDRSVLCRPLWSELSVPWLPSIQCHPSSYTRVICVPRMSTEVDVCILKNFTPIHMYETDRFFCPLYSDLSVQYRPYSYTRVICVPRMPTEVEVYILKNFTPIHVHETDRFYCPLYSDLSVLDLPYSYTRAMYAYTVNRSRGLYSQKLHSDTCP